MPWPSIIGIGGSCFATCTDNATVLKGYEVWEDGKRRAYCEEDCEESLAREALVYKHLGEHPQILRCFGLEEVHTGVHSLRLELAPLGNIRQFIVINPKLKLPERIRMQMALDVAMGLCYIHSRNVIHSDISCRNLFLFNDYRIKIGDFGGSVIQGHGMTTTACEEIQYELPSRGRHFDDRPVIKRELFALGSAMYEITMWMRPFQGLDNQEIEARYAREEFPDLDGTTIGPIIRKCWNEEFETSGELVEALRKRIQIVHAQGTAGDSRSTLRLDEHL